MQRARSACIAGAAVRMRKTPTLPLPLAIRASIRRCVLVRAAHSSSSGDGSDASSSSTQSSPRRAALALAVASAAAAALAPPPRAAAEAGGSTAALSSLEPMDALKDKDYGKPRMK